jgi:hypothetical protein
LRLALAVYFSTLCLFLGQSANVVLGQQNRIARQHHPWGRCQVGAWKIVRVTTETFADGGAMTSVTDTKTTLTGVDENGVTLLYEVVVEILPGKQIETQPRQIKQDYFGESADHETTLTQLEPVAVTIQGRKTNCRVYQLATRNTTTETVTKVYYSDTVEPYILKRDTVKSDIATGQKVSEAKVDVIATDVPCRVLGALRQCSNVRCVNEHANGTSTTLAVTSSDVPGDVVCHTLKEVDSDGQMVRRSTLELIDYGHQPEERPRGLFRWKRLRRGRTRFTR